MSLRYLRKRDRRAAAKSEFILVTGEFAAGCPMDCRRHKRGGDNNSASREVASLSMNGY